MSVYVDNFQFPYRGMKMSHMVADTTEELLAMADKIGVQRKWLQPAKGKFPEHFDVCESKRQAAIEAGAEELQLRPFCAKAKEIQEKRNG